MQTVVVFTSLILSVIIGGFFVSYLHKTNKAQLIKILLAFSGGFLLSIAFNHFIPELYHHGNDSIGMFILLGFLVQLLLEFFSGGIEHGHVHVHEGQKMPWGLFLSLSVHSVLEGIPLGNELIPHALSSELQHGHEHGHSLLLGILFHQLPVSIALMTMLVHTKLRTSHAWGILMLFGIMTPLGVLIGMFDPSVLTFIEPEHILAVVVGMFLHISTTIIFETSENHKVNLIKLGAVISGLVLALLLN
jgi:zinc transporter ZupT